MSGLHLLAPGGEDHLRHIVDGSPCSCLADVFPGTEVTIHNRFDRKDAAPMAYDTITMLAEMLGEHGVQFNAHQSWVIQRTLHSLEMLGDLDVEASGFKYREIVYDEAD